MLLGECVVSGNLHKDREENKNWPWRISRISVGKNKEPDKLGKYIKHFGVCKVHCVERENKNK